jgi:hypothetical protein
LLPVTLETLRIVATTKTQTNARKALLPPARSMLVVIIWLFFSCPEVFFVGFLLLVDK